MNPIKENHDMCDIFCYDEEKVSRVSELVNQEKLAPVADLFKALSDQTRLKIAYPIIYGCFAI